MYTITTPQGFVVGFIAKNKKQIKTWIAHSYSLTLAGWQHLHISTHKTWPNNVTTIYDVTKEMKEIEAFLAQHSGIWYNNERVD